jgi:hypothetical protein
LFPGKQPIACLKRETILSRSDIVNVANITDGPSKYVNKLTIGFYFCIPEVKQQDSMPQNDSTLGFKWIKKKSHKILCSHIFIIHNDHTYISGDYTKLCLKRGYEEIRDRNLLEILKKDRTWLKYELHCNVKTPGPLFSKII